jgi:hypothetical protein
MSKLGDRIKRASRVEPAPLGFAAAAARRASPTLLCLVRLSQNEAAKVEEAVKKGADAVILEGLDAGKSKDVRGRAGESALGVSMPGAASRDRIAAAREAGADFAVLEMASAMADALLEEKIGLVLSVDGESDDTTLRLIGDLGLEALIIASPEAPLSVQELLRLRRLAALARTPLLTHVSGNAEVNHLQALRESGVAGVIVDSSGLGKLEGLRERIAALPARGKRKEEKAEVMLPAGAMSGGGDHEHDDDDD